MLFSPLVFYSKIFSANLPRSTSIYLLFELKYHSFVRALSGAYVTFGKNPDLTLIKKNDLNGMKAFEVGNCRYCNATYVIGKIVTSSKDNLSYLIQNDEVDIYDNYGDEESVLFFLIF